ncbi:MAG: hypothetical protein FJ264_15635 [Planctomycetes bacterium]|nr:hypothetical protein [Planctomycetota bacterium]
MTWRLLCKKIARLTMGVIPEAFTGITAQNYIRMVGNAYRNKTQMTGMNTNFIDILSYLLLFEITRAFLCVCLAWF